jgi:Putative bacterial sensory transduction regulator
MDIEKFELALIERFLRDERLAYFVDRDGDFHVDFNRDDNGRSTTVDLLVDGLDRDVYVVRAISSVVLPPTLRARADQFTMEWNRTKRWPKAFTVVDADAGIHLIGESSWVLRSGIHWPLFRELTITALSASFALFEEFTAAPLPPTSDELEHWIQRAGRDAFQ